VKRPEGPLYGLILFSLGGALVVAGIALGVLMIAAAIGPFFVFAARETPDAPSLGLWLPGSAFAVPPVERERRLRAWRAATARRVDVQTLESLEQARVRVVALTDGRALSEEEGRALRRFVESGGGAILTGALGVRQSDGAWRSWKLMEELLGAPRVVPLDRESSRQLVARGRGPLTAGLSAGQRIRLHAEPGVPALDDAEAELGWWGAATVAAASRRLSRGRGRIVWLGAGPESTDEQAAEGLFVGSEMTRLLGAAIAWAGREPFLEVLAWPAAAPLAALVEREGYTPEVQPPALARAGSAIEQRRIIDAEIARAARSGRLFRLELPPAFAAESARRALVEYATRRLREEHAWFGHRDEIARWRRLQTGLTATIRRAGPRRHLIDVVNRSREAVAGAVLRIHINDSVHAVDVERTTLQQEEPIVSVDLAAETVDIALPRLAGGSRHAYTLDLERAGEAG
jgi:hypothetical protein